MQITLNKIPFDVTPVAGPLRATLLADPAAAGGVMRDVWAWDGEAGRFLVPVAADNALPLPTGIMTHVARPGAPAASNGAAPARADGPTAKMAERLLAAVGAKTFAQVMQALSRVTGIAQRKVPLEAFSGLNALGPYRIRLGTAFSVVELANPARNLQAFVFVPGLVTFWHVWAGDAPEGAPAPGTIAPGFVIPPGTDGALAIRRMAGAQRLNEVQAGLGGTKPADLPQGDPRRAVLAQLGAEWRVLAPKPKAA